jgi:hypothetical protein
MEKNHKNLNQVGQPHDLLDEWLSSQQSVFIHACAYMHKVFCDITGKLQESVLYVTGSKNVESTTVCFDIIWSSALASCNTDNKFPLQITCITLTSCLQQHRSSKVITTHVWSAHHQNVCMLPVMSLNVANACIPVCFWYQQQIHLWSLVSDVLLLVYNHHNLKFTQPHRKKPNGLQACGWVGQSLFLLNPLAPEFFLNFSTSCI